MSESAETEWHTVCGTADLDDESAVIAEVEGTEIAVFRTDDGVFALLNVCPHQGGPLGEGRIEDDCVYCPWHGWQFDLSTGEHVHKKGQADTFETRIEGDEVLVEL